MPSGPVLIHKILPSSGRPLAVRFPIAPMKEMSASGRMSGFTSLTDQSLKIRLLSQFSLAGITSVWLRAVSYSRGDQTCFFRIA